MENLIQIVREEVTKYAGNGRTSDSILFLILDDENQNYAVDAVPYPRRLTWDEVAEVVVLARVVGDKVSIEANSTDKKLVDALLQRGNLT